MGFAALLMAAGLLTLRTGVFARWTGLVALLGGLSLLIIFLTLIAGTGEDSVFGFGFFPGVQDHHVHSHNKLLSRLGTDCGLQIGSALPI
jgi:hypothetical protein